MLDLKRTSWNFGSCTPITFGPNAITTLVNVINRDEIKRVLLITDKAIEEAGAVQQVQNVLEPTAVELNVFAHAGAFASTDNVRQTSTAAHEFQPDLLLAMGGGSVMDMGKATAVLLKNRCTVESLFDNGGVVSGPVQPLVCIPTTAGTGSEVSSTAVLRNSTTQQPRAIVSSHLHADRAIVDPYMTLSCSPELTAASGTIALANAVEAYLSQNFFQVQQPTHDAPFEGNNPLADLYAEKAIQLIAQHLRRAVAEPENLTARSGMSLAATLGGIAVSNTGAGLCRAITTAIDSTRTRHSFGTINAIVLPHYIRHIAAQRPAKIAKLAAILNPNDPPVAEDEATDAVVESLCVLRKDIGLPDTLESDESELVEKKIGAIASNVLSHSNSLSPSPSLSHLIQMTPGETNAADIVTILRACFR